MAKELTEAEKVIIETRETMARCRGFFEYRVRDLQDAGITAGRAVKYVAAQYPVAHADYLERAKKGLAGSLHGGAKNA